MPYQIVSFYHFTPFSKSQLNTLQKELEKQGENITGLILLGTEGINATLFGTKEDLENYLKKVEQLTNIKDFFYKKSPAKISAFKALRIKVKKEIIAFKKSSVSAEFGFHNLEPEEWEAMLNEQEVTLLDIRNDYEVDIGQFKKAKNLNLKEFSEFPEKVKSAGLSKEQKTLLYCTGGIRCEKAIAEMKKQGFKEVYQLKGGILHYLKSFPNKSFEGECFVFDRRAAVDQNLNPSQKYSLCPHCGQAGGEMITCMQCGKKAKVCQHCLNKKQDHLTTCTKNCAYHFQRKNNSAQHKKQNTLSK